MCGIAGKLWFKPDIDAEKATDALKRMAVQMASRGPDGQGVWVDGRAGVAFSHRRLRIIDLDQRADQPMQNEDGSIHVTFNGEIYNYRELRAALGKSARHVWRTESDTEVLLHLYEEHGADVETYLNQLRGMFAFGLWDGRRNILLLARDPIGKKPLFFRETPNGLTFASTIKALLEDEAAPRDVNVLALQLYLVLGYIPAPFTAFQGIRKLQAGHYLIAGREGIRQIRPYWAPEFETKLELPEWELEDLLIEKLEEATRLRMISDVPLGAFLSGGIDSSAVVAMMARCSSRPVKTFSVAFAGTKTDESSYARLVAKHFGCDHTELSVDLNVESLPDLILEYEEPFADGAAIPTYFMSKIARRHATVVLNGDGGDEDFAGYTLRHSSYSIAEAACVPPVVGRTLLGIAELFAWRRSEGSVPFRLRKSLRIMGESGWRRNVALIELFLPSQVTQWFDGENSALREECVYEPVRSIWHSARRCEGLDRELYFSFALHLPEQLLVKVDRASMAWSLEVRSPLLDGEFVKFCARIPQRLKLRGFQGKYIFKRSLRAVLPGEILSRKKQGFNPPLDIWLRRELREVVQGSLLTSESFVGKYLPREVVHGLVNEHLSGKRDHQRRLYALLNLELWARHFILKQSIS